MLREAYRVIRPEGQIVIAGFNPFSLYGAKRYFGRGADAAVERQLHRALSPQGLADAARLRRRRRPPRRLRAAVRKREVAAPLRLLRVERRPLVADRGRRLLPARDQARARHARAHAGLAAPRAAQEGARAGARAAKASRRPSSLHAVRCRSIYTDGACKGNPGLGGWGALLRVGRAREGALRRRGAHHQQPHGAHRRHPRAGVAEARLARSTSTPTRST